MYILFVELNLVIKYTILNFKVNSYNLDLYNHILMYQVVPYGIYLPY